MCRISGIISNKQSIEQLGSSVKKMSTCLAHGGPDDEGFYADAQNSFVFGHRRLSIIDLSEAGHQPMLAPDHQLVLTFNGEIFNYLELKVQLVAAGYQFKTNTDTEVILAGYAIWDVAIFAKLEGMFAFVLFDGRKKISYLVRDQSGIKPLYYANFNSQLIFASEVKAFQQSGYSFSENQNWKTLFLAFGHIPEPFTTLGEVKALPKASYLEWSHQRATFSIHTYFEPSYTETIDQETRAIELIHEKLTHAVKVHLLADAPIGVFLSGGIDSSILTLLANQLVGEQLNTVSINFVEEGFSEAVYQQIVSAQIKGQHRSYLITEHDFQQHFAEAMGAMDQPTQDGINSWFVNKCAKENGLKAVLSGIGADELFGGYPSFKRMKLVQRLAKLPKPLLRLARFLPSLRLKRIYYLSYRNNIGNYLFLRGMFSPDVIAKLLGSSRREVDYLLSTVQPKNEVDQLPATVQASWLETNLYMQNQLLKDTDFMSMAHGIEVRVPFLDQNLMQAVNQINHQIKYQHQQSKWLLIESFKDLLPDAIWNRPKMGFTFPFGKWLIKNENITDLNTYQKNETARELMQEFKQGKLHWSMALALFQVFKEKSESQKVEKLDSRALGSLETEQNVAQNILFLTLKTFSLTGGIEKVCRCLAMVLTSMVSPQTGVRMYSLGDDYFDILEKYLPIKYFKGFNNNKLKFSLISFREALKADTLILSHINLLSIAYLVKLFKPAIRVIMFAHGIEVWRPIRTWKRRFLQKHVEIWAVSNYTSTQLQTIHRIPKSHIQILNNCLDPFIEIPSFFDKPKELLARYQLSADQPILLTLTRLSSSELYKGYDLVIKAMPVLVEKFPTLKYLIAGKADEKEKQRLEQLIEELDLGNHVSLVGFLPDEELTDHFLLADAFVMPSRKEGFGIVFIEAAACGCTVIAGNQDGSVDALLNGELGMLIEPDNENEITSAIVTALKHAKTDIASKQVQQLCLEHFGFEIYQAKVKELLTDHQH